VDTAPMGLLAAWLDTEIASTLPTTLDRAELPFRGFQVGPIALEGRVDRVDQIDGGGSLVIDYKTGKAPAADDVRAGLKVQGFVYLEAIAGGDGAAVYQELRGAAELTTAGWVGTPEELAALGAPERKSVALGPPERAALTAHLAAAGERLAAGVFHPSLAGPKRAGCGWCEFHRSCRVDHARSATIAARGDPRWQAPLLPANDSDEAEDTE
jgi:RecB family exonuclease